LLFLLGIGFSTVFGQEIPEDFYISFQLYENQASNDDIALSSDKSTYEPGEYGILFGLIYDYIARDRVFITIIDPSGQIREEISVGPTNEGTFKVQQQIPEDSPPGKYIIRAKYGESGNSVSLQVTLQSADPSMTKISIPLGSLSEDGGVNFKPKNVQTRSNKVLQWTNNDNSVHTVVSGTIGIGNKMFSDGQFDSGIIPPKKTFELSLEAGNYDYFCRLHPWLVGSITVNPSQISSPEILIEKTKETELFLLNDAEEIKFWESTPCQNCFSNVTLSSDKKEGFSGIVLNVQGSHDADGPRSSFDLSFDQVDITNFDSLVLWIKTKGNVLDSSRIILLDKTAKLRILTTFNSHSFPEWTRLNVPLHEYVYEADTFDAKKISNRLQNLEQ